MIKRYLLVFLFCGTSIFLFAQVKQETDWVRVEGGSFMMGCEESDKECYPETFRGIYGQVIGNRCTGRGIWWFG